MASCYFLMVTVLVWTAASVTGNLNFTLSTEENTWSEARDACTENGSILVNESNTQQIDELLTDNNISQVWTGRRTFLSDWVANQGCHTGNLTDIQGRQVGSPAVGRCQLHCHANESEYFTLQDTDVCKCLDSSTVARLTRTLDAQCNVTCGGGQEVGTKCGGTQEHVVSLYRTPGFEQHDERRHIICEDRKGAVTCPTGTVLDITYAKYGLTKQIDSCPKDIINPWPDTNCKHPNSTAIMRGLCNGRRACSITASNERFGGDPCSGTTKLLNISYTCVPADSTEDLCRVFQLNSNNSVTLQSEPCGSQIMTTACTIYNESTQADAVTIITHLGTWENAVVDLCKDGYIPPLDNTTRTELLQTAKVNYSIWSGYIRQLVDVYDTDLDLEGSSFMQCYARENNTSVRLNCTEKRPYICQKEPSGDENTTEPIVSTETTPIVSTKTVMPNGNPSTRPPTRITTTRREPVTVPKPRKSSREDTKIIGMGAGITVGCIVLVVVTAVVVDRVCKRSAKKKREKKKKTKPQPVRLKEIVINDEPAEDSIHSDSSTDESEHDTTFTAGRSSAGGGGAKPLPSVSYNYEIVNGTGIDKGHVNDAYAYAETTSTGSAEGMYDAMDLVVDEGDEDDHMYAHTMLPLPDNGVIDDVSKQPDGETYDVMQSKCKAPENDSAYDHTENFSERNGTTVDGAYDVFNGKVKGEGEGDVGGMYDYTQSVSAKNGDMNGTMYDDFKGKVKGDDEISNNMYDHTDNVRPGQTGDVSANDIYDTCTGKANVVDDVDDMYDHTTHPRGNQDENLYDLTSKREVAPSVDEDHYEYL